MLAAVEFHDDPGLEADEIKNIAIERHLAAEFEIGEAAARRACHSSDSASVGSLRMPRAKPRRRDGWRWRMADTIMAGGAGQEGISERADPLSCEN